MVQTSRTDLRERTVVVRKSYPWDLRVEDVTVLTTRGTPQHPSSGGRSTNRGVVIVLEVRVLDLVVEEDLGLKGKEGV